MTEAVHLGLAEALARISSHRDPDAWAEVLEQAGPQLSNLARRITGDAALADDVVQETLLQVRDSAHQFRPMGEDADASARRWMMRIAANVACQLLRQNYSRHRREIRAGSLRPATAELDPALRLERSEQDSMVRLALSELPEPLRAAIVMRHMVGAGIAEIAAELGIPEGTAKVRIHRGIARLRDRLSRRDRTCTALSIVTWLEVPTVGPVSKVITGGVAKSLLASSLKPTLSVAGKSALAVMTKIAAGALVLVAVGAGSQLMLAPTPPPAPPATQAISLFNGHDLTGWDAEPGYWMIKDGAISGTGLAKDSSTFCVWQGGPVDDFDLSVEYRLTIGNSGIGFRDDKEADHRLAGYQADLNGDGSVQGNLFDQERLGVLAECGERTVITADGHIKVDARFGQRNQLLGGAKPGSWNTCRIIAKGDHVIEMINGVITSEFTDLRPLHTRSGVIGLEMYGPNPGFDAQFRNIQLTRLPKMP